MGYATEEDSIILPIPQMSRRLAQRFAQHQPNPEKAEKTFNNTLAVLVVNDFLQMLGIETDLLSSDSWNSVIRLVANIADLSIPNLGKLECRAVKVGASNCSIPLEARSDRIGYVIVEFDEHFKEGKLLGFVPQVTTTEIPLCQLKPLDALLDHLTQLQIQPQETKLREWLEHLFTTAWQEVEEILKLHQTQLALNFRSSEVYSSSVIRRAKIIDLGLKIAGLTLALVVELYPQLSEEIEIYLQLHPFKENTYLPANLHFSILDKAHTPLLTATSRDLDNYMQLKLVGCLGEQFQVKISWGEAYLIEKFMI